MPKTIVSVSKKHNSVWRMYYYDIDDDDNTWKFYAEKINPLLVWFYKLKKRKNVITFVIFALKNLDFGKADLIKCLINVKNVTQTYFRHKLN